MGYKDTNCKGKPEVQRLRCHSEKFADSAEHELRLAEADHRLIMYVLSSYNS